jgi:ABC-type cobalt transport system substrate-binding protein
MKNGAERGRLKTRHWLKILFICILISVFCSLSASAAQKWQGVDEAVVEKVAKEHGREASEPFINTDRGDLPLFVFMLAGTIGGFAAGYCWRVLTERRSQNERNRGIQK